MDWKSYLELSNDSVEDLRYVGYLYVKQGCYDIALEFFNTLLILDPKNSYDLQTLGALYLQKGKYLEALEHLDEVIKIEPTNPLVLLNKARALLSLGYRREGIDQARIVATNKDKKLSSQAMALISAYL
ncbi:MAG: hypothetical protein K940chlam1_00478 [Candidatus Anoxychlamydiales bacterium]|nr:hypothetical protein [Candidatus Anoxychlamydiales bacterium]NGX35618.1 hypothetical protein [Candidatus Anoxychlamydiales bacterium]